MLALASIHPVSSSLTRPLVVHGFVRRNFKINKRIAKFVKSYERNNPPPDGGTWEDINKQRVKDIYESYKLLNLLPESGNATSPNNTHSAKPTSIFGQKNQYKPRLQHKNGLNEQDYMTMNEPKGPELKYHQLKKLRKKLDELGPNVKPAHENTEPLPPNVHSNKYQKMDYTQHNQPIINEYDPHATSFKNFTQQVHAKANGEQAPQGDKRPNTKEETDEEFEEFFKHNFGEGLDEFVKDREKYGNYYGNAKVEDDESTKTKEKEKEKQKKKMEEKRNPTPEDVDRNARKYIKQFIFKIHPDFFNQDAAKKSVNMHSLQMLNSFLESIRALREPSSLPRDKIPAPFTISFHVKGVEKPISTTFHLPKLPDGDITTVFVTLLRQRAYEGIADLIAKAKIKVEEQDQWILEGSAEQEKRDFAHSRLPKHWRPIGWSPKDQDYGIIEILMEHCRFMDFNSTIRESPFTRHQQEKLAMLVKDFFYFDSLTPEESERAVDFFYNCVHLVQFDQWCRIPVVFSTRKGCERLRLTLENEGFLVIPFDFEVEELQAYLKKKLKGIKERREELVAQAKRDMQQVEAMKEQLKLALGPKEVTIEEITDREKRKAKLARYLIRASRAVDIEMGYKSNSILQNDYRQLEFQREQDKIFIERREGLFPLKTLGDIAMLPPVEPKKFDLPTFLSPSPDLPKLAGSPSTQNPSSIPAPPTGTPSLTNTAITSREDSNQNITPPLSSPFPSSDSLVPSDSTPATTSTAISPSDLIRQDHSYHPIQSISPQPLSISDDESVVGPRLGFGRDASESPNMRIGYTGLMLDLDEDDRAASLEAHSYVESEDEKATNAYLEKYRGVAEEKERESGLVSGEFYHGASALHCLQHLTSLAMTEMKTAFPWHAIKIVVSDHYHMEMTNGEPTLYVPCYFDVATLRKVMETEGGAALKKIQLEADETNFLLNLSNKVRGKLGVHSVKISKDLKGKFQDQVAGLATLMNCDDPFSKLGKVDDVIVVVSTTFAFDEDFDLPKLFVPFDFTKEELVEFLETGEMPEKYKKREQEKKREVEEASLSDDFWDTYEGTSSFGDVDADEGFDEHGNDIPIEEQEEEY